jgi:hypothetical protein
MTLTVIERKQLWNTLQEPRCKNSSLPTSYLLLLSALDGGWQIDRIQLLPTWDQHGLVYLVILKHPSGHRQQELILPRNALVETLLDEGCLVSLDNRQFHPLCI